MSGKPPQNDDPRQYDLDLVFTPAIGTDGDRYALQAKATAAQVSPSERREIVERALAELRNIRTHLAASSRGLDDINADLKDIMDRLPTEAEQQARRVRLEVSRAQRKELLKTSWIEAREAAQQHALPPSPPSPPKIGWTILALACKKDELDAYAGDLEESFGRYCIERGRGPALAWYWWQLGRTVVARAWPMLERLLNLAELVKKVSGG